MGSTGVKVKRATLQIKVGGGDQAGGDTGIAAAKAIKATISDEFAKYG